MTPPLAKYIHGPALCDDCQELKLVAIYGVYDTDGAAREVRVACESCDVKADEVAACVARLADPGLANAPFLSALAHPDKFRSIA